MDIYSQGKLCFVGTRINFLQYDEPGEKHIKSKGEKVWPLKVEYNFHANELVYCTTKDLRFLDLATGKTKKIYSGFFVDEETSKASIATFRLVQQNKKFILGDLQGHMALYDCSTGEEISQLKSHTSEITNIKIDYVNKIVVTTSADSSLYIHKENGREFEVKRKVSNVHFTKEITFIEISVYHNVFATANNKPVVYFYDFEFARLVAKIELDPAAEPTGIIFINGYSLIAISDTLGKIHFVKFTKREISYVNFEYIGSINVTLSQESSSLFS